MSRFLSEGLSGYSRLTEHLPFAASSPEDDVESEKIFAQGSRRWSTLRELSSVSGLISLILLVLGTALRCAKVLLPSFLPPLYRCFLRLSTRNTARPNSTTIVTNSGRQRPRLSSTAWLDGLRGVAAFVVFIYHFNAVWLPVVRYGYNSPSKQPTDPPNTHFFQLPIMRLLLGGRASVVIFFVVSGFVLSLKTLSIIHAPTSTAPNLQNDDGTSSEQEKVAKKAKLLDTLSGSLMRRPIRLFLPVVVSTAIVALLARIELFFKVNKPTAFATWQEQLADWWGQLLQTMDPFWATRIVAREQSWQNDYNGALWTIPIEYKGSIQIFVLLLVFGGTKKSWIRWAGVVSARWWQLAKGDADMTLFCAGLLLAEAHILRERRKGQGQRTKMRPFWERIPKEARHLLTILVFVVALYLLSYPDFGGEDAFGFQDLARMVPDYYYTVVVMGDDVLERMQHDWLSIGAILFVWAVMYSPAVSPLSKLWLRRNSSPSSNNYGSRENSEGGESYDLEEGEPLLQKLFSNDFAQYLGKISYSLYPWHTAIQNCICWRYYFYAKRAWDAAGVAAAELEGFGAAAVLDKAWWAFAWAYIWTLLVDGLVVFWVSDVFYRTVDLYSVRLAKKAWGWVSGGV